MGKEFQPAAQKFGLEKLAVTVTRLCQMYLGLSDKIRWCQSVPESQCEELMEEFIAGGNFGKKRGDRGKVTTVMLGLRKKGYFRGLQRNGILNWEACRKHSWLKPFAWLYQIVRLVRKSSGLKIAQIQKGMQESAEWEQVLQRLGLK